MPTDISEKALESLIVAHLRDVHGYEEGISNDYNKTYGVDTERVKRFILATQRQKAENTACFTNPNEERKFFKKLSEEITKRGVTDLLRKGFRYITELFDMYYPLPSELNPSAKVAYERNIFCVTRQLFYSTINQNSIDVMVSINGLPLMTMELKNHYTSQTIENAIRQYQTDRDPKKDPSALILVPKRLAVHFAVDDDSAMMCTELKGKASWFLPFNKGYKGGAGNPVNPNGLRTAYLWEEVLEKHSLSDIIENYAQIIKKGTKDVAIWPRYHQLDAVRRLVEETRKGVGQRFLIQHSAGSGKSNSITWLAYQLVGLLNGTEALMDSVIVVTDRINLDKQIRDNIQAFQRLGNLVTWADSSASLKDALAGGKKIIITIVHKYPYILEAIGNELKHKRFGIIIDEAHSGQNGSMSAKMNIALSGNTGGEDLEDKLLRVIEGRKMVKNANYYAFTATPKNKTLQMFGVPFPGADDDTSYRPFHEYTMKQAIEEGFIMDVLRHYTTYNSFYKLVKSIEGDPEFDDKRAQGKLRAWVESRPETIAQKAAIIVNHFHTMVIDQGKVGGQARAMVVTSSIIRAIELYFEISRLLQERKSPYKAVVAFSGSKEYGGKEVTEADVNGFPSAEIEERMGKDPYRILVVADKFQTGYDQPLLHTMYVDKILSDVKAVQTLSRLNRCHPYKRDTMVIDFANDEESIKQSFQRFYKTTILSAETDPDKLNNLIGIIEAANFYTMDEVETVNEKYWENAVRSEIDPIINLAVDRFKQLTEDKQISSKSAIKGFRRIYSFIAAVTPYKSLEWEKLNTYYDLLLHKLPVLKGEDFTTGLIDAINLDQIRVVKQGEKDIQLENEDGVVDPVPVSGGKGGKKEPDMKKLSDILDEFNKINWLKPDEAKRQLDDLSKRITQNTTFVNAAKNSNKKTAEQQFASSMMQIVSQMLKENSEFCRQYLDNQEFKQFINTNVFEVAYAQVTQPQQSFKYDLVYKDIISSTAAENKHGQTHT